MLEIAIANQSEGRFCVTLKGRLDTQTYALCEQHLQPLLQASTKVLTLDLAQLDYLSSMGLRVLLKTTRVMSGLGGKCLLTRLQPSVRSVIDIAHALPPEDIFASIEEADRYLDTIQRRVKETGSSAATLDP